MKQIVKFSAIFERVWLKGLLHKLGKYDVKGDVFLWIQSYQIHRKQNVFVNVVLSSDYTLMTYSKAICWINVKNNEADTYLSYSSSNLADIGIILNDDLKQL